MMKYFKEKSAFYHLHYPGTIWILQMDSTKKKKMKRLECPFILTIIRRLKRILREIKLFWGHKK